MFILIAKYGIREGGFPVYRIRIYKFREKFCLEAVFVEAKFLRKKTDNFPTLTSDRQEKDCKREGLMKLPRKKCVKGTCREKRYGLIIFCLPARLRTQKRVRRKVEGVTVLPRPRDTRT